MEDVMDQGGYLVANGIKELQPLTHVLVGAEQVKELLVVDLQQRHLDGELGAVIRQLLKDLVQRPGDDAGQRVFLPGELAVWAPLTFHGEGLSRSRLAVAVQHTHPSKDSED